MTKLKLVESPKQWKHLNVLLYGPPKSGKTAGATSAPGPLLHLNADRPNATRWSHMNREFDEVRIESLQTLIDVHSVVGDYETIVIDTLAETYGVLLMELSDNSLHPEIQNYGDAGEHLLRFCRFLIESPANVVLVAHDMPAMNDASATIEHLPLVTTKSGSPAFAAKLLANVDVIGYTGRADGEGDAPPRYLADLSGSRNRWGGDRTGVLGEIRELDLADWLDEAKKATAPVANELEGAAA